MKRIFSRIFSIVFISIIVSVMFSCHEEIDGDDAPMKGSDKIDLNIVCKKWRASAAEVSELMAKNTSVESDNTYQCYKTKHNNQFISYEFKNDELIASMLAIPSDKVSLEAIQSKLVNYVYLGEANKYHIYINESEGTMATIEQGNVATTVNTKYYFISFISLALN